MRRRTEDAEKKEGKAKKERGKSKGKKGPTKLDGYRLGCAGVPACVCGRVSARFWGSREEKKRGDRRTGIVRVGGYVGVGEQTRLCGIGGTGILVVTHKEVEVPAYLPTDSERSIIKYMQITPYSVDIHSFIWGRSPRQRLPPQLPEATRYLPKDYLPETDGQKRQKKKERGQSPLGKSDDTWKRKDVGENNLGQDGWLDDTTLPWYTYLVVVPQKVVNSPGAPQSGRDAGLTKC
ncbi:hypothetical protein IF1G_00573 [Cordyceps javanica]|uniref:Uncharacterized protein n=1 Tax=Cordyceps javanica TaxID=43265 RepID=A0A545VFZ9_9HYPO|nr:hypothetical protein IF1G_00573 [Cordyceps javanica]